MRIRTAVVAIVAAALPVTTAAGRLAAQAAGPVQRPDSQMAPVEQYLMADFDAEVALARSAAPPAIAAHAEVLVLGRRGYTTAVSGTNGFVCAVERSFMGPFDSQNFWDRYIRGPICYNPAAARSIVPLVLRRTALILAGLSKAAVLDSLRADAHHPAAPGAMGFMLSKHQVLAGGGPWRPHLMFYAARPDSIAWGADMDGSPVLASNQQFTAEGQPIVLLMIPVETWSDGSARQSSQSNASSQPHRREAN